MDIEEKLKNIKLRLEGHEEILLALTKAMFEMAIHNADDNKYKEMLELQQQIAIKAFDILKEEFGKDD